MASDGKKNIIKFIILCLISSGSVIFLTIHLKATLAKHSFNSSGHHHDGSEKESHRNSSTPELERSRNTKTILFWTSAYEKRPWAGAKLGGETFRNCPYSNCAYIVDRTAVASADILLFSCRPHASLRQAGWPKHRLPHQKYVVFCGESPSRFSLAQFSRKINMTASYRTDSDIFVGRTFRDKVATEPYKLKNPFANKTKYVAWFVSNCYGQPRARYARQLKRYIDVDIYGKCGNNRIYPKDRDYFPELARTYKFYLSFENSVCRDYVTEKLSNPLSVELIPIVLGGGNYTINAPPSSVINILDHSSPRHLAQYLHHLAANETMYTEFFRWKRNYDVVLPNIHCAFCEAANKGDFHREATNFDLQKWWYPPGACYPNIIQRHM